MNEEIVVVLYHFQLHQGQTCKAMEYYYFSHQASELTSVPKKLAHATTRYTKKKIAQNWIQLLTIGKDDKIKVI